MNKKHRESRRKSRQRDPTLKFSPYAWAKLIYLRDRGDTEVGGFGIAAGANPLHVTDIELVEQHCSYVTVEFDDEAVADFVDRNVDAGLTPAQCLRIWVHTHPGDCASPSSTDEETFARVFGNCDWALMFILAQKGETYARLRFNVGPGGDIVIPVEIDFDSEFMASNWDAWETEYETNVSPMVESRGIVFGHRQSALDIDEAENRERWMEEWAEYAAEYEAAQYEREDYDRESA